MVDVKCNNQIALFIVGGVIDIHIDLLCIEID